ncbi:hypothetical protein ACWC1D_37420, partial [Streptomyces sp. NPDC001478]
VAVPYRKPARDAISRSVPVARLTPAHEQMVEDELIRALGVPRAVEAVRAEGDLRALQTFRRQPAQQGRPPERQLRRFLGTKKGRKIQYGRVLVEALDPDRVPAPLDALLTAL